MKRLTLKKLIVISESESRSLEVPFTKGLNIIIGGNKTGKSSVIKSIFTTLGCECPKVESDWKKLISTYILLFTYGEQEFCIYREGRQFCLFKMMDGKYICLIDTEHFHEYSNCLMNILQIKIPCVDNKGKTFNVTPPLLFRFQYIDQDEGWRSIAESFTNMKYIKNWKGNSNKFVCGYLDSSFYDLKVQQEQINIQKDEFKKELGHNQQFVTRISSSLYVGQNIYSPEEITDNLERLLLQAEEKRETQFDFKSKLGVIENQIFIDRKKLHLVRTGLHECKKDIDFAMLQPEVLCCPTCGAEYTNNIESQLTISTEHSLAEKLANTLENELNDCNIEQTKIIEQYELVTKELCQIESQISESKKMLSYSIFYKNEGKQELLESCTKELEQLQGKIDRLQASYIDLDSQVKNLKSDKRSKEIKKQISNYCKGIAETIAIPQNFIKLKDFVQTVNRSGSDAPRLVYMYQSALYLYNLDRAESPFSFFVVDTPNQQGQDTSNLQRIFDSIELFNSTEGQVILGTERETGYENKVSNVIRLTEKRRCLSQDRYEDHVEYRQNLRQEAIRWTSEKNVLCQNE